MAAATGAALTGTADFEQEIDPATAREKPKKSKLTWLFNKAADMAGRALVTNTFKIAAITVMAGIGASSVLSIGAASLASGVGSALYVYGKEAVNDYRAGNKINWGDATRIKKARNALLIGAAGGAFGAWLAHTEFFKAGVEALKHLGGRALDHIIPSAMAQEGPVSAGQSMMPAEVINAPRPPADIPVVKAPVEVKAPIVPKVHAEPLPKAAVTHNAVRHVVKAPVKLPVALPTADQIAAGAADAKDANNVLGRLWATAMNSDQAKGKFMAQLLKADPDNLNSVSPQFLKDRAHEVLRLKDIPLQERLTLAHDLAAEAKARGNKQAAQFLKDLVKLGYVETPAPVAAVVPVPEVAVLPEPVIAAPAAVAEIPAIKPFFTEAASCTIDTENTVICNVKAATMKPGDYVSFTDAGNAAVKAYTPLVEGSTDMPTQSFLHERLVADGVARITALRSALLKKAGI